MQTAQSRSDQHHDVEPVADVPGDYRLRRRGQHRQLHVRQRLRTAARDRTFMALGADSPGLEGVSPQGLAARPRGRGRRLRTRHDLRLVLGPQLAGVRVWPMWLVAAVGISVALALVASYFPAWRPPGSTLAPRFRRPDPCSEWKTSALTIQTAGGIVGLHQILQRSHQLCADIRCKHADLHTLPVTDDHRTFLCAVLK